VSPSPGAASATLWPSAGQALLWPQFSYLKNGDVDSMVWIKRWYLSIVPDKGQDQQKLFLLSRTTDGETEAQSILQLTPSHMASKQWSWDLCPALCGTYIPSPDP
jgi:hypothetical protein